MAFINKETSDLLNCVPYFYLFLSSFFSFVYLFEFDNFEDCFIPRTKINQCLIDINQCLTDIS